MAAVAAVNLNILKFPIVSFFVRVVWAQSNQKVEALRKQVSSACGVVTCLPLTVICHAGVCHSTKPRALYLFLRSYPVRSVLAVERAADGG